MHRLLVLVMFVMVTVAGCSQDRNEVSGDAEISMADYERALGLAKQAQAQAEQNDNQWTTAQDLIERSARLASEGNLQEAVELLGQARQQLELTAAQAEREARDWQQRVIQ